MADHNADDSADCTMASCPAKLFRLAIVGLGIAGRSRVRDIPLCAKGNFKGLEHVRLAGFVSRQDISEYEGIPRLSLENVLDDESINAVIISTENARHEAIARQALNAKKHVLVDYPLSLNATAAKELHVLAHKNGVVLYEEDIALLTEQHVALMHAVKDKPAVTEVSVTMHGGINAWIGDFESSGTPFVSGINLLHTLVEYFGDLQPYQCSITRSEDSYCAKGLLMTKDKRLVNLVIDRAKGMKREKKFKFSFTDGSVLDHTMKLEAPREAFEGQPTGLFMRDLLQFVNTVEGKRDHSHNQWLTIRCLEIADELLEMSKSSPEQAKC